MMRNKTGLFSIVLLLQSAVTIAAEPKISADFLEGKWSNYGKEGCTSELATFITFRKNQTLEAGKGKSVRAVGFWESNGDNITLHILVSPGSKTQPHPFYQGRYYYQHFAPRILTVNSDTLEYAEDTGAAAAETQVLTRCQ